jgi:pilus assembly protein CpaB
LNLVLNQKAPQPTDDMVDVVVAKAAVPRGKLITPDLLEVKSWPKDLAPAAALSKLDDVKDRSALQAFVPGEPVFESKLAVKGAIGGMASLIPTGKRAYTIQTKASSTKVGGFVLPGNLVDVLLTFRSSGVNDDTGGGSTTTILQAVEVLAVGKQIETITPADSVNAQEIESVTILVTPEQVARLDLGQTLGMLSLSLRNPNDLEEAKTSPATIADIRFQQGGLDTKKFAAVVSGIAAAFSSMVPKFPSAEANTDSAAPEQAPQTAILTLRGQTWGAVRVLLPERGE